MKEFVCPTSGIRVPEKLADLMVPMSAIVPNTWNPNKMDADTRRKLSRAIIKDGFIVPVIVRPLPASRLSEHPGVSWEIVDGEHRWLIGKDLGMPTIPIVNVGAISDDDAKAITIKANALRGEFDSVQLAEMISGLAKAGGGVQSLVDDLPFSQERLQAMVDLVNVDVGSLLLGAGGGDDEDEAKDDGFKAFDPTAVGADLDCQCPRCGFQFQSKKEDKK